MMMRKKWLCVLVVGLVLACGAAGSAVYAAGGKNYVDADQDGICDNRFGDGICIPECGGRGICQKNFVDADEDGICDNYVDADENGICDNSAVRNKNCGCNGQNNGNLAGGQKGHRGGRNR